MTETAAALRKLCKLLLPMSFFPLFIASCNSQSTSKLEFSEDEYKNACLVTRNGGGPSKEHMAYLKYEPQKAQQEGVFMISVINPLGSIQMDCASFVLNDQGEKTVPAMKPLDSIKLDKDNKIKLMIVGYTNRSTDFGSYTSKVRLKTSDGNSLLYDAIEKSNMSPIQKDCVEAGCGFVHFRFLDVKINETDMPLFTSGNHAELSIKSLNGNEDKFVFNVPEH